MSMDRNSLLNEDLQQRLTRYKRAFADLDAPFAAVDMDALDANANSISERAADKGVRLGSKSVRCISIINHALQTQEAFFGVLSYTLAESLWLSERGFKDILLAYPTTDCQSLKQLDLLQKQGTDSKITLMVDCVEHLDLIEQAIGTGGPAIRVCIDIDAGYPLLKGRVSLGPKRSPLRYTASCVQFAKQITARPRFQLVGLMGYEAQISSIPDDVPGQRLKSSAIRALKRRSASELAQRRSEIVTAVSQLTELELVNGGGTGSIESTRQEPLVTEIAIGSGLYAPTTFNHYRAFEVVPAAFFSLPIIRRPNANTVAALGGGYVASGSAGSERLPSPYLPSGLELTKLEGAGETHTPLTGPAAATLSIGDRVYLRHNKSGELCEHFNSLYLVRGDRIVDQVPTYRGEGKAFL